MSKIYVNTVSPLSGNAVTASHGVMLSGVASGTLAGPSSYLGIDTEGLMVLSDADHPSSTPGGSDTEIQYNDGGAFGGVNSLTYVDGTGHLIVADDKKLHFGGDEQSYIVFESANRVSLVISGAADFGEDEGGGVEISGSALWLDPLTVASGTAAGPGSLLSVAGSGKVVLTAPETAVSALNNAVLNRLVTVGSPTTELDGEATLVFDSSDPYYGSRLDLTGSLLMVDPYYPEINMSGTLYEGYGEIRAAGGLVLEAGGDATGGDLDLLGGWTVHPSLRPSMTFQSTYIAVATVPGTPLYITASTGLHITGSDITLTAGGGENASIALKADQGEYSEDTVELFSTFGSTDPGGLTTTGPGAFSSSTSWLRLESSLGMPVFITASAGLHIAGPGITIDAAGTDSAVLTLSTDPVDGDHASSITVADKTAGGNTTFAVGRDLIVTATDITMSSAPPESELSGAVGVLISGSSVAIQGGLAITGHYIPSSSTHGMNAETASAGASLTVGYPNWTLIDGYQVGHNETRNISSSVIFYGVTGSGQAGNTQMKWYANGSYLEIRSRGDNNIDGNAAIFYTDTYPISGQESPATTLPLRGYNEAFETGSDAPESQWPLVFAAGFAYEGEGHETVYIGGPTAWNSGKAPYETEGRGTNFCIWGSTGSYNDNPKWELTPFLFMTASTAQTAYGGKNRLGIQLSGNYGPGVEPSDHILYGVHIGTWDNNSLGVDCNAYFNSGSFFNGSTGSVAGPGSYLGLDTDGKMIVTTAGGGGVTNPVADDTKLYFGDSNESYIQYRETSDNYMVISGSANGIVLSGSNIRIGEVSGFPQPGSNIHLGDGAVSPNYSRLTCSAYARFTKNITNYRSSIATHMPPVDLGSNGHGVAFQLGLGTGSLRGAIFGGSDDPVDLHMYLSGTNYVEIAGGSLILNTGSVTSGSIAGLGSYLGVTPTGQVVLTASAGGGGGGTPGGSATEIQFNASGSFGGHPSLEFDTAASTPDGVLFKITGSTHIALGGVSYVNRPTFQVGYGYGADAGLDEYIMHITTSALPGANSVFGINNDEPHFQGGGIDMVHNLQGWPGGSPSNMPNGERGGGHRLRRGLNTCDEGTLYYLSGATTAPFGFLWHTASATISNSAPHMLGLGMGGPAGGSGGASVIPGIVLEGYFNIPSAQIRNAPAGTNAVVGTPVYVSNFAGKLDFNAPTGSGEFVRVVGYALADDYKTGDILIRFNPDPTWVDIA